MHISVLLPSYARPDFCHRMIRSIRDTYCESIGHRVDVWIGVNSDDPYLAEYAELIKKDRSYFTVHLCEFEKGVRVGAIWNALQRRASAYWTEPSQIFLLANDDLIFQTMKWNEIISDRFVKLGPYYLLWADDKINGEAHCAFPFVTQPWINAAGGFVPEFFLFFRHDTWIYDIGKRAGVLCYCPDVVIEHRHFTVTGQIDATTRRNRDQAQHVHDLRKWNATERDRIGAADRIRAAYEGALAMIEMKEGAKAP